jgi:hypothetical protein
MRIDSGLDLISLYLGDSDGYYPSQSPTCAPKMTLCVSPAESCLVLDYVTFTDGKQYCRFPSESVPEEYQGQSGCPQRRYNARVGLQAQRVEPAFSPVPARAMRDTRSRQDRRRERIIEWVRAWLEAHFDSESIGFECKVLYHDFDMMIDAEKVAALMFHDYLESRVD